MRYQPHPGGLVEELINLMTIIIPSIEDLRSYPLTILVIIVGKKSGKVKFDGLDGVSIVVFPYLELDGEGEFCSSHIISLSYSHSHIDE